MPVMLYPVVENKRDAVQWCMGCKTRFVSSKVGGREKEGGGCAHIDGRGTKERGTHIVIALGRDIVPAHGQEH